ncbi:MAG: hypothetical protein GX974_09480, partial [Clostridiales bacterium]|nr:hypothetical protein [Clostridiales bacterium]
MKLTRVKKKGLIIAEIIFLLLLIMLIVFEFGIGHYEKVDKINYQYKSKGDIDYRVKLRPNI